MTVKSNKNRRQGRYASLFIAGLPCSGKSTLLKAISSLPGWESFDGDRVGVFYDKASGDLISRSNVDLNSADIWNRVGWRVITESLLSYVVSVRRFTPVATGFLGDNLTSVLAAMRNRGVSCVWLDTPDPQVLLERDAARAKAESRPRSYKNLSAVEHVIDKFKWVHQHKYLKKISGEILFEAVKIAPPTGLEFNRFIDNLV